MQAEVLTERLKAGLASQITVTWKEFSCISLDNIIDVSLSKEL